MADKTSRHLQHRTTLAAVVFVLIAVDTESSDDGQSQQEEQAPDEAEPTDDSHGSDAASVQRITKGKRTPWSVEHLALLKKTFGHYKKPPDCKSIRKLLEKEPSLRNHTIPQIRSRAWALIISKR